MLLTTQNAHTRSDGRALDLEAQAHANQIATTIAMEGGYSDRSCSPLPVPPIDPVDSMVAGRHLCSSCPFDATQSRTRFLSELQHARILACRTAVVVTEDNSKHLDTETAGGRRIRTTSDAARPQRRQEATAKEAAKMRMRERARAWTFTATALLKHKLSKVPR